MTFLQGLFIFLIQLMFQGLEMLDMKEFEIQNVMKCHLSE